MKLRFIILAISLLGFFLLNTILTPDSHWVVEVFQFTFGIGAVLTLVSLAELYDDIEEEKNKNK